MRYPLIALTFCLALVAYGLQSPDVQADHQTYGCAGSYGCAGAQASCAGRGLLARRPVRRFAGFAGRIVTSPVRAVANWNPRIRPSRRFGCGG